MPRPRGNTVDVSLAVLADYANVSREGKLNIMGIFDRIFARQLPGQFPPMQVVIRLDAHYAEMGREHTIQVQLQDPDGEAVFDINGAFTPMGGEAGEVAPLNHILSLGNLPLRKPGGYSVVIWVNNDLKKQIPLKVVPADVDPPGGQGQAFSPPGSPPVH
jgi:hypothetical protein